MVNKDEYITVHNYHTQHKTEQFR